MCWVNVEPTEDNMLSMRINLAHAIAVEEYPEFFRLNYPGEGYYRVKKTPEMIEAYNNLVPAKSQPVVPAEPNQEEPFRVTGFGLYEMRSGEQQRVTRRDPQGIEPVWLGDAKGWYFTDGRWNVNNPANDIVKLIKLDEV